MLPRIVSGTRFSDRDSSRAAARASSSGCSAPTAHSCPRASLCSSRRNIWPRFGPSPPSASRLRQQRCPWTARPVTASAAASASAVSEAEPPRSPWPRIRKLALTAGCCIAWLYVASTFQSSSPFAAISLGFRSAAQTGEWKSKLPVLNMECRPTFFSQCTRACTRPIPGARGLLLSILCSKHSWWLVFCPLRHRSALAGVCSGLRGAFTSGGAGFGAGVLHTLAGADHLAVATRSVHPLGLHPSPSSLSSGCSRIVCRRVVLLAAQALSHGHTAPPCHLLSHTLAALASTLTRASAEGAPPLRRR